MYGAWCAQITSAATSNPKHNSVPNNFVHARHFHCPMNFEPISRVITALTTALLLACNANAQTSGNQLRASITVSSDLVQNGQLQTNDDPALQLSVDYEHRKRILCRRIAYKCRIPGGRTPGKFARFTNDCVRWIFVAPRTVADECNAVALFLSGFRARLRLHSVFCRRIISRQIFCIRCLQQRLPRSMGSDIFGKYRGCAAMDSKS